MNGYRTLASAARAEIVVKKSVFITDAAPVGNEEEAGSFIESVKKANKDASHGVFAYRVGIGRIDEKYSDAGEPSGTAGLPALSVMRKEGVTNAVVVVTRYFGGILLGAAGLVRAYQAACKAGIDAAGLADRRLAQIFSVSVPYTHVGRIRRDESEGGYVIRDSSFAERVEFVVHVPFEDADSFVGRMDDMTNGTARVEKKESVYV